MFKGIACLSELMRRFELSIAKFSLPGSTEIIFRVFLGEARVKSPRFAPMSRIVERE